MPSYPAARKRSALGYSIARLTASPPSPKSFVRNHHTSLLSIFALKVCERFWSTHTVAPKISIAKHKGDLDALASYVVNRAHVSTSSIAGSPSRKQGRLNDKVRRKGEIKRDTECLLNPLLVKVADSVRWREEISHASRKIERAPLGEGDVALAS